MFLERWSLKSSDAMISDHDDHDGSDFNAVQHKSHDNFGVESDDTIIYGSQVKFKNLVGKDRKQILGAVSRNPTFSLVPNVYRYRQLLILYLVLVYCFRFSMPLWMMGLWNSIKFAFAYSVNCYWKLLVPGYDECKYW